MHRVLQPHLCISYIRLRERERRWMCAQDCLFFFYVYLRAFQSQSHGPSNQSLSRSLNILCLSLGPDTLCILLHLFQHRYACYRVKHIANALISARVSRDLSVPSSPHAKRALAFAVSDTTMNCNLLS